MNKKFIDKYGFMNFKSICETIPINLSILKNKRKIKDIVLYFDRKRDRWFLKRPFPIR